MDDQLLFIPTIQKWSQISEMQAMSVLCRYVMWFGVEGLC